MCASDRLTNIAWNRLSISRGPILAVLPAANIKPAEAPSCADPIEIRVYAAGVVYYYRADLG